MQLSLQNFTTMIGNMAASAQGACSTLLDVSVGSVLRALLESSASVALWLQYLILQVLSLTRLSTSTGNDVDSWVADYGMARLPAIAASGSVTMTSLSPAAQSATIVSGATVKTSDGSQSFTVVGGPYQRTQKVTSAIVQVQAMTAGPAGNVQAGAISILGTAIPGIDTVTNALPLSGGLAAESDQALRLRFVTYLNTRSQATEQAIANAIASVRQGLSYIIQENSTSNGALMAGYFNVIVDDGSGIPPGSLLQSISEAIDKVRPIGSRFSVNPPQLLVGNISLSLSTADPSRLSNTKAMVIDTVAAFINSLPVGQALRYSRVAGLAYAATPDVANVISILVNGGLSDLGGQPGSVVRAGSINVVAA